MKISRMWNIFLCFSMISLILAFDFAKAGSEEAATADTQQPVAEVMQAEPNIGENISSSDNVTMDFKEADIQNVIKIISYKSGVNIVTTPEVMGTVTIRLVDVPWEQALDVILKTCGFSYQRQGNIILVAKTESINKIQAEEPLQTAIIVLKFLDAGDAQKILIPLLSSRGKISVLYAKGQKGWKFGSFKIGKEELSSLALEREKNEAPTMQVASTERTATGEIVTRKAEFEPSAKSKTLVVTDTAASLDRIRNVILPQIDKKPKQVLIEARIMEVNLNKLRDIGFDWGTGSDVINATSTTALDSRGRRVLGGRTTGSGITPALFGPLEGAAFSGAYPYSAGLDILFRKLTGTEFEVILHALEQNGTSNVLSSPRILTLDNQEASILVGYHTPILSAQLTAPTTTSGGLQTQTLDYYQEIGIRLNVVPQISDEGYINMIIHPSVTSSTSSVPAESFAGNLTSVINYPVIDVREAQTQVLMRDGETIVLGGLLKDVKSKEVNGVPFLSKIPILGELFKRETIDKGKIDLLIFITAHVLPDEPLTDKEVGKIENSLGKEPEKRPAVYQRSSR